ncbi:hypothetical protein [Methyloceanibacter caenitepidi]|uniref:Uncharacterized protein n=1 Tax=Methyloceanibacter caenitepidi TaxID=1384459 RepID=A0A0A8K0C1_9HYPH|nr:hypothetical protein [Methyloceanibacter caenitepidi]BAQ16403.1 hypothetical protein GL4_0943 [Methyloceanibacter caenitepidi]
MRRSILALVLSLAVPAAVMPVAVLPSAAVAAPARIVILTSAEAADAWQLCEIGSQRAQGLRYNYLGDKAAKSLFVEGTAPAFFFAITPHTVATVTPAASSWRKPVIHYSVLPNDDPKKLEEALHERTREAAGNVLNNPALRGKTIVMVWDRRHIADPEYDRKYEREAAVTLRQLFHLDIVPGVPREWPAANHDYFWVVDFPENSNVPLKFEVVKQDFGKSFPDVPANDWGEPAGLDAGSGCRVE